MYRHCIHCSAGLGANESLEAFPVGRMLAFDGEKGRLWAICAGCGRWNLAPIEERWEAVEDAERRFADAPKRASTGTLAMAKLRDGTRLVRVGGAPPAQVAVERYGDAFSRRRLNSRIASGTLLGFCAVALLPLSAPVTGAAAAMTAATIWMTSTRTGTVHRQRADESADGRARSLRIRHVKDARVSSESDGTLRVELPGAPRASEKKPLVVRGEAAGRLLTRALPFVNRQGGDSADTATALDMIRRSGGAAEHLRLLGEGVRLDTEATVWGVGATPGEKRPPTFPIESLALEIALHEERERRAMEGELRVLAAAWREAEEIAGIADRLAAQMGGVRLFGRPG